MQGIHMCVAAVGELISGVGTRLAHLGTRSVGVGTCLVGVRERVTGLSALTSEHVAGFRCRERVARRCLCVRVRVISRRPRVRECLISGWLSVRLLYPSFAGFRYEFTGLRGISGLGGDWLGGDWLGISQLGGFRVGVKPGGGVAASRGRELGRAGGVLPPGGFRVGVRPGDAAVSRGRGLGGAGGVCGLSDPQALALFPDGLGGRGGLGARAAVGGGLDEE
ncbi:hypothetical protein AB0C27_40315 [Nonomuraea sp. NPDC048882]|uniref:hypothetical protein n=1 Tax=Nonomuraea sp. NPDC048882 TaxID=3154347 RepID=UPI0033DAFC9B